MATIDLTPPQTLTISSNQSSAGQVWAKWIASVELYFLAAGITDKQRQKALLLYLGGDELREIHRTLEDKGTSFDDSKTLLDAYFLPKKNLTFERSKFRSTVQAVGETSQTFLTRLRSLAMSCDFNNYSSDAAIIDQFIERTTSQPLRRQLLRTSNLTLPDLVMHAQAFYETSTRETVLLRLWVNEACAWKHGLSSKRQGMLLLWETGPLLLSMPAIKAPKKSATEKCQRVSKRNRCAVPSTKRERRISLHSFIKRQTW